MIFYSWNVNGLRAAAGKGFHDWLESSCADVVGLQETKLQKDHENGFLEAKCYKALFASSSVKKGYSGGGGLFPSRPPGRERRAA